MGVWCRCPSTLRVQSRVLWKVKWVRHVRFWPCLHTKFIIHGCQGQPEIRFDRTPSDRNQPRAQIVQQTTYWTSLKYFQIFPDFIQPLTSPTLMCQLQLRKTYQINRTSGTPWHTSRDSEYHLTTASHHPEFFQIYAKFSRHICTFWRVTIPDLRKEVFLPQRFDSHFVPDDSWFIPTVSIKVWLHQNTYFTLSFTCCFHYSTWGWYGTLFPVDLSIEYVKLPCIGYVRAESQNSEISRYHTFTLSQPNQWEAHWLRPCLTLSPGCSHCLLGVL